MNHRRTITAALCAAAIALGGGAISVQAAEPVVRATLPDHIINGDFEYLKDRILAQATDIENFANVDYERGQANSFSISGGEWFDIEGFNATEFGWKSTQTDASVDGRAPIVEIQRSRDGGNAYGEITASQIDTYIYQDIDTQHPTDTIYTVRLKHASRNNPADGGHVDALSVLIGPPGQEQPVELTRTASDVGDMIGETSTVVKSRAWSFDDQWDTYETTITIPANQSVTRFSFQAIESADELRGNNVDDITFAVAYPLTYDLNGGTGTVPNRQ